MRGDLKESFVKDGETIDRALVADAEYLDPLGNPLTLPGRSLLLVRNVGSHLDTDMVLWRGEPIYETMLDAMVTVLAAKHDLMDNGRFRNSRAGSIYVVKPKMHGPNEVALAGELFFNGRGRSGAAATHHQDGHHGRRATHLGEFGCVYCPSTRAYLPLLTPGSWIARAMRSHTIMEAGPVLPKEEMKGAVWLRAYERANVDAGLACGFMRSAQIGKGMWAAPDEMAAMLESKIMHPKAGANTAWVPSPTVATLHAMHYHLIEVHARQQDLLSRAKTDRDEMLELPLLSSDRTLSDDERQRELDNNAQGLLGYVSRWVGQGIGCSKVPDINNVDFDGRLRDAANFQPAHCQLALSRFVHRRAGACDHGEDGTSGRRAKSRRSRLPSDVRSLRDKPSLSGRSGAGVQRARTTQRLHGVHSSAASSRRESRSTVGRPENAQTRTGFRATCLFKSVTLPSGRPPPRAGKRRDFYRLRRRTASSVLAGRLFDPVGSGESCDVFRTTRRVARPGWKRSAR